VNTAAHPPVDASPLQRRVPTGQAGWWHQYVCPVHGSELVDAEESSDHTLAHACPHGCRLRGEEYDGAWRVLRHQECARTLRASAHRYARHGQAESRADALVLLGEYVELYEAAQARGWTDAAQPWMLRGKLFHQALTEALWGAVVADAVATLARGDLERGEVGDDLLTAVPLLTGLIETMTEARRVLVEERGELRNNYTAWLNCAGVTAERALEALGRPTDVERWLSKPGGLYPFLEVAVAEDGWEWEGATYYHVFVLRACLIAVAGSSPSALPAEFVSRVERMLRVLVDLSSEDGLVPVLHDGPYSRRPALQELLEVCVLGRQLVNVPGLGSLEYGTRSRLLPGDAEVEDLLDRWFVGEPLAVSTEAGGARRTTAWGSVGYLVLRPPTSRWHAVVDAGPHGGSHGHRDKLALYLYGERGAWQPAPGVPPYGSVLRAGYYSRTVAHPTFRVDGLDQAECTGEIVGWKVDPSRATATVAVRDAYPGVQAERHLVMTEDYLLDALQVTADQPRQITLGLRPARPLEFVHTEGLGRSLWRTDGPGPPERLRGVHRSSATSTFEVLPGRGPSDDPSRMVGVVDWSVEASTAWFVSVYQLHDEEGPAVENIDLSGSRSALAVTLTGHHTQSAHTFESAIPPHPQPSEESTR